MNIKLVKLSYEYKEQLIEMLTEWKKDIEDDHLEQRYWIQL